MYLNARISQYQHKMIELKRKICAQETEHDKLIQKLNIYRNNYSQMALLLTEFFEAITDEHPSLIDHKDDIYLNVDEM